VTELQANELLIAGFGHLYYQPTEENPGAGSPYTNHSDPISFYMTIAKRGCRPKRGRRGAARRAGGRSDGATGQAAQSTLYRRVVLIGFRALAQSCRPFKLLAGRPTTIVS
jgi:hypothetical protein